MTDADPGGLRSFVGSETRTVRFRTAAGAVLIISASLIVAAISFDLFLARELRRGFESSLITRAVDRAVLVDDGADPEGVVNVVGDEEFVVVLSPGGEAVAFAGLPDPGELAVRDFDTIFTTELSIYEHGGTDIERTTLHAYAAATANGGAVVVGSESHSVSGPRSSARRVMAIGVPLLILVAAVAAWRLAQRALAPVEAMREDVSAIAGGARGERLTVSPAGDELTRLASTMNELLDRIDAHGAQQRRFVADASHELKSPVANLRALAETSQRPGSDPEWEELRRRLVGEAERLRGLVDDLLFLARADESRPAVDRAVVHLDDLVFDEAERAAIDDAMTIDASAVTPVDVRGDASQLTRVIRNLIDNAIRHAESSVSLAAISERGRAVITVDDDGPGIPFEERERIFERFARLDTDRSRAGGGTGLGLAIVRQIVTDHEGVVVVSESPAGGARFSIDLPTGDTPDPQA